MCDKRTEVPGISVRLYLAANEIMFAFSLVQSSLSCYNIQNEFCR